MQRSPLHLILFVTFVDLVGFGLIIPLQAVYAERLGATGLTFGLLVSIYSLMQLLFNPLLGKWSDRIGRRPVLMLSIAGSTASHALLGIADLYASLPLLFVARTLDGITGANVATAQACIADVTTPENRARGMGLFGAAFGFGFVMGPAIGALLAALGREVSGPRYGTAWPAFGAAGIAAVALCLVWKLLPESRKAGAAGEEGFPVLTLGRLRALCATPRLRELLAILFSATSAFVLLEATFVYLCARRFQVTERGTGLLYAYFGVMMVLVQGILVGRLVRRFGEAKLLSVAPFVTAAGFLLISTVPLTADFAAAWLVLLIGCVPTAIGHGLTGPNLSALISRQASGNTQGSTLGVAQSVGSLARTVAPAVGGLLYDIGPSWPYWVGAAILIAIGLFALWVRPAQDLAIRDGSGS